MGNIHPAGVKKDDHGGHGDGDQQLEVVSVLELQAGGVEDQLQPIGGWPSVEATSMLENDKTNSTATHEIGTDNIIDISPPAAEPDISKHDDSLHPWPPPRSLPAGVLSVLNTSRVKRNCIGDGDGFTAYEQRIAGDTNIGDPQQYRIRMKGIDAPELQMKYGVESKDELVRLIGGKHVSILVYGLDKYGRSLGDIYCDGVFIQEKMLKGGFAWHYKMCDKRPEFSKWQREAKVARRGLWSLDKPQKPWVWRRDNPRTNNKKENFDDNKVEPPRQINGSSETLPLLIMKDMEDLGRKWKENLENSVSENMKLHDQVQELKRDKKEAEERAKKTAKEMKSVVADNMKLKGQLQESERNKKEAQDRVLQLEFFSGSVAAVNMDLHHKIEVLENENKEADDRAKEKESEMESVGAENRKLQDQLQVAEGRAVNLTYFSGKFLGVNKVLHDNLEELKRKNKLAEERAEETDKEMERILNDNIKLNDQIQKLKRINKEVASSARNSKKKLQSVLAVNMDLDKKEEDLGTSSKKGLEIVGAENMKGKPQGIDQIPKLKRINKEVASSPRNSKEKLQRVLAVNMDLDKKEEDLGTSSKKGLENVGAENMKGKPQGTSHKKSEQTVEIPSTPPAKDFGVKEWRKKTNPTTSSAPPLKGHYA